MEEWLSAWRQTAAKSERLLAAIEPAALAWRPRARAWTVGQHFRHLNQVRCDWIAGQPGQSDPAQLPKEASTDQQQLLTALAESAEAMAAMLASALERGKISGFRGAPAVFVAYLVAHEAYHWGEVGALLAQQGTRLPRELAYGLWEDWG